MDVVSGLPPQRGEGLPRAPHPGWDLVPEQLRAAATAYIDQIGVVLRPATVRQIEGTLREFCVFVTQTAPEVKGAKDIGRRNIEAYKLWLTKRTSAKSRRPLTRTTVAKRLGYLANFFQRVIEWGWEDAPPGVPVLPGDRPIPDERLPRFIDDGAATKLLVAARSDDDSFVRLAVEFLARTGLRIGEFLDLTIDAVVQIGSAYWLRVPVGKLHNDRYIPLHPQLKEMLDEWLADRPVSLRSRYMFIEKAGASRGRGWCGRLTGLRPGWGSKGSRLISFAIRSRHRRSIAA
jgi:integrase